MLGNVYLFDKDLMPITCNQNVLDMLHYKSTDEFKTKKFEQMGKEGGWPKEVEHSLILNDLIIVSSEKI